MEGAEISALMDEEELQHRGHKGGCFSPTSISSLELNTGPIKQKLAPFSLAVPSTDQLTIGMVIVSKSLPGS